MKILIERDRSSAFKIPSMETVITILSNYFYGSFTDNGFNECYFVIRGWKGSDPYPRSIAGNKFDIVDYGDIIYCEKKKGYLSKYVVVTEKDFEMLEAMKAIAK